MNWVIHHKGKIKFHTYLDEILEPLKENIKNYNWILSDLEFGFGFDNGHPINLSQEYFVLEYDDFQKVLNRHIQMYWGVIIAVPSSVEIKLDENNLPFCEGNPLIWQNGNLQYTEGEIEIDCFDSSYTIIKFSRKDLSNKFKAYFDETIELEKFNS